MALTGELTLSGRILPVSGIREKVLAAQRAGVTVVVFPKANNVDIVNLEDQVKAGLEIVLADAIEPLMDLVLLPKKLRSILREGARGARAPAPSLKLPPPTP